MGIRIDNQVTNQLSVPMMLSNTYALRPSPGIYGRLFISNDTKQIYQDQITAWNLISDAGSGSGTLASVCANGNSTATSILILNNDLTVTGTGKISANALTDGSMLFAGGGSGIISQDNANFFWDNTNKRLGIGNASPGAKLDVHGTGTIIQMNGTGTSNSYLQFQNAGTNKWYIGNSYNATNNDFIIYDNTSTAIRAYFLNTGYAILPNSVIIGSSTRTSSYGLDVYNSANFRSQINGLNAVFSSTINAGVITGDSGATGTPSIVAKVGGGGNNGTFGFGNDTSYLIKGGSDYGNMQFVTGGSANTRMTIKSTGEVLINASTSTYGAVSGYNLGVKGTTGQAFISIARTGQNLDSQGIIFGLDTTQGTLSLIDNLPLIIATNNTPRMYILSGGNIGIGDYSTTARLLIKSGGNTSSTSAIQIRDSSNTDLFRIRDDGYLQSVPTYNFTTTSANYVCVGSLGYFERLVASSLRFKEEIKDWNESGLNTILALKPKTFKYKKDYYNKANVDFLGLIAEEVAEVSPYLADYENENRTGQVENVKYATIVVPLIKAIQELNEKLVRNNIN